VSVYVLFFYQYLLLLLLLLLLFVITFMQDIYKHTWYTWNKPCWYVT